MDAVEYLRQHHIPAVLNTLIGKLCEDQPQEPLEWMAREFMRAAQRKQTFNSIQCTPLKDNEIVYAEKSFLEAWSGAERPFVNFVMRRVVSLDNCSRVLCVHPATGSFDAAFLKELNTQKLDYTVVEPRSDLLRVYKQNILDSYKQVTFNFYTQTITQFTNSANATNSNFDLIVVPSLLPVVTADEVLALRKLLRPHAASRLVVLSLLSSGPWIQLIRAVHGDRFKLTEPELLQMAVSTEYFKSTSIDVSAVPQDPAATGTQAANNMSNWLLSYLIQADVRLLPVEYQVVLRSLIRDCSENGKLTQPVGAFSFNTLE